MTNRIILVTGAAKGIGEATVRAFAALGDHVVSVDLDGDGVAKLAEELGPNVEPITADIGDLAEIERIFAHIKATHGRLDVLVNNAGITRRATLLELTEEDWDRIVRVNAKGAFFCMQAAAKQMIEQGNGRIINMASIAGKGHHMSSNAIYVGTKGALVAQTAYLSHHLGPHGVTINSVCPGITQTDIYKGIVQRNAETRGISVEQAMADAVEVVPLRRANDPSDIADLVVFLASDGARNINGQSWNVDGGLLTH